MYIVFIIFIGLSIIIESSLIAFPLTLMIVSVFSLFLGEATIILAFFAGLVLDLLTQRLFGIDSLFFLLVYWIIGRYQRKIYIANVMYLLVFIAFEISMYSYFFYAYVRVWKIILADVLSFILIYILNKFYPNTFVTRQKISL